MSAHVQIRTGASARNGVAQIIVDDVDITDSVLSEGFEIGRTGTGPHDLWFVQIRVVADLDIDLTDAIVEAVRA